MFLVCFFCGDTLTSTDFLYGVTSGFIFSTDQSVMSLLNQQVSKLSTHWQLLSDWSIYFIVLHMIGRSKMNERLHDKTSNRMLLGVCTKNFLRKIKKKRLILIILMKMQIYTFDQSIHKKFLDCEYKYIRTTNQNYHTQEFSPGIPKKKTVKFYLLSVSNF